jgi:hypothetical protein
MSVLEDALLGFAQTVGWNREASASARRVTHTLRRRAVKGEVEA